MQYLDIGKFIESLNYEQSWVAVLLFMGLVDMFYVFYTRRTAQGHALTAGFFAIAIALAASFVVISYNKDPTLVIPACIGSFIATVLTVRWDSKRSTAIELTQAEIVEVKSFLKTRMDTDV